MATLLEKTQQIMQMVGVIAAALSLPLVLQLLNSAYGIGSDTLPAPQAALMESVAVGIFQGGLPWNMVYIGMGLGVLIILADQYQAARKSDFRIPVLAVAVGLYLPFELDSAIMVGGVIAWLVSRYQARNAPQKSGDLEAAKANSNNSGLLFASGLITGEALIGIILAIPIAIYQDTEILALLDQPLGSYAGLLVIIGICYWLYNIARREFDKA